MKEQGTYKEKPKKSRRRPAQVEALTATEAIERMLEKKKISSKINYDVLRDLNRSDTGSASPETGNNAPNAAASSEKKGLKRQRSRKNKDRTKGLAATASTMSKRLRPLISTSTKKKLAPSVEPAITSSVPSETLQPTAASEPTPPLDTSPAPPPESAPPQPPDSTEVPQPEDPHTEEEEEEEEEQCVSALELIGDYGCEAEEEEIY